MPKNWEHLPNELKQHVIGNLDYPSRCSLRITSKAHVALVDSSPIKLNRAMIYIRDNRESPAHVCTAEIKNIGDEHGENFPLLPLLRNLNHPRSTVQKFIIVMHHMETFKKLLEKLKEMNFSMKAALVEWYGEPEDALLPFLELVNVDYCKTLHFEQDGTGGYYFVQNRALFNRFDTMRIKCRWRPLDAFLFSKVYHLRAAPRPIGSFLQQIPTRSLKYRQIRRMLAVDDRSRVPHHEDRGLIFQRIDYFGLSLITWVCPVEWRWKALEDHLWSTILTQPFFDEASGIGGALGDLNNTLRCSLARERQRVRLEKFTRRKIKDGRTARHIYFKKIFSVHF